MMKRYVFLFFLGPIVLFANSVSLLNDSTYTLQAMVLAADGTLLGSFVLNPSDATQWTDDSGEFGVESSDASQTPYTINWYCMQGSPFGVCTDVGAGALVTAQSCQGAQECPTP